MHCGASLGLARLPGSARPARPPRQLAGGALSARYRATQLRLLSRRQPAASVECRARVAEQAWEGEWDSDEEDSDDEIEYDSDGEEVERPFGPPALVLAGFYLEELVGMRVMLDQAGGEGITLMPTTSSLLRMPVEQVISLPEPHWDQPIPADWVHGGGWGTQRMVFFSGMGLKAQALVLQLLAESEVGDVVPVVATPANAGRLLGQVLAEGLKAFRSAPPSSILEAEHFVDTLPSVDQVVASAAGDTAAPPPPHHHQQQQQQQQQQARSEEEAEQQWWRQQAAAWQAGGAEAEAEEEAEAGPFSWDGMDLGSDAAGAEAGSGAPRSLEELLAELGAGGWEVVEGEDTLAELMAQASQAQQEQQQPQQKEQREQAARGHAQWGDGASAGNSNGGSAGAGAADAVVDVEAVVTPQQQTPSPAPAREPEVAAAAAAAATAAAADPVAAPEQQPGAEPDWGLQQLASELLGAQGPWVFSEPGSEEAERAMEAQQKEWELQQLVAASGRRRRQAEEDQELSLLDRIAAGPAAAATAAAAGALSQPSTGSAAAPAAGANRASTPGGSSSLGQQQQQQQGGMGSAPAPLTPNQLFGTRVQPDSAVPSELLLQRQQPRRVVARGFGKPQQQQQQRGFGKGAKVGTPAKAKRSVSSAGGSASSSAAQAAGAELPTSPLTPQASPSPAASTAAASNPRPAGAEGGTARAAQRPSQPEPDSDVSDDGSEGVVADGEGDDAEGVRIRTQRLTAGLSTSTERGIIPGQRVMTKNELREVAAKHGLSFDEMLAAAEARGIELPD